VQLPAPTPDNQEEIWWKEADSVDIGPKPKIETSAIAKPSKSQNKFHGGEEGMPRDEFVFGKKFQASRSIFRVEKSKKVGKEPKRVAPKPSESQSKFHEREVEISRDNLVFGKDFHATRSIFRGEKSKKVEATSVENSPPDLSHESCATDSKSHEEIIFPTIFQWFPRVKLIGTLQVDDWVDVGEKLKNAKLAFVPEPTDCIEI